MNIGESPVDEPTDEIPAVQPTDSIEDDAAWGVYSAPAPPASPRRQAPRSGSVLLVLFGSVLLAIGVIAGFLLAFSARGHVAVHASAPSRHRSSGHRAASPAPSPTATSSISRAVQVLKPARIAAFGPGGTGQGDSPQLVRLALHGTAARPWHSSWYTTAHFGNLQSGTGLILEMKREVTITRARISLGYGPGASLELRVGNRPVLSHLHVAVSVRRAGHDVRLHLKSARGRYVLLWFTRLPPDHAGTFQASVYRIVLVGHR